MHRSFAIIVLALALAPLLPFTTAADNYTLVDDYSNQAFFEGFNFFTDRDPTEGFVAYQGLDSAIDKSLVGYLNGSVFVGTDATNKTPSGRPSIRLESKKTYNKGLFIADIVNMPGSTCGSWPALWLVGPNWPANGEIDLLEGVNDEETNSVTLHTSAGCAINGNGTSSSASSGTSSSAFSGQLKTANCDVNASGQDKNVGCSIGAPSSPASYGTGFNAAGGGVYAMLWTSSEISAWFFPRNKIPNDITAKTPTPGVAAWGTPVAHFAGSGCDFDARFRDMQIVVNTAFCGQWAGAVWQSGGCAKKTGVATCEAYVRDNPEAFTDAYWEIKSLRWYENRGGVQARAARRERRWAA